MNKQRLNYLVEKCNESITNAEQTINELSDDEIIELKAELNAKSVHTEKWIIVFLPFLALAISVLPLLNEMAGANADCIGMLAFGLLIVAFIAIVRHGWISCDSTEKRERTKVYLEEYTKERIKNDQENKATTFQIETFEQLEKRQRSEREKTLNEWRIKQDYINRQIDLYEKSLRK